MDYIFESTLCTVLRKNQDSCESYLRNVTHILAQYSWVYSVRNIDIFLFDVLQKIPNEWVEMLSKLSLEELCLLPFGSRKEEWPTSLKLFLTQCNKLADLRFPKQKFENSIMKKDSRMVKKATDKKQLEIEIMSHFIHKVCHAMKCNVVLDIGSGLGYLDQALHYYFGICSIGLDSVSRYTLTAKDRIKSDPCRHSILHETVEVKNSEACLLAVKSALQKRKSLFCSCNHNIKVSTEKHLQQSAPVVMVGLHSCGNLQQDMMKLFCKLEEAVAFICVGCCYNKINTTDFPMSLAAKSAVEITQEKYPLWYPCTSGLRLASHGTRSHSASFPINEEREKNMFYRSLLEYYLKKENIVWHQPKRHVRPADLHDFPTYCSKMFEGHILSGNQKTQDELNLLYKEKEPLFERIRILLVLQKLLQPLWEAFVSLDRIMYFKEKNIEADVIAMWDDSVSSRNLALYAYKNEKYLP